MHAYPPQPPAAPAPFKLAGMVLASFVFCITIVLFRGVYIATYVYALNDVPGAKADAAVLAVGALVLGFYIWSAVGIYRGQLTGLHRLMRLSVVFGVVTIVGVVYNTSSIPYLDLVRSKAPLLWALIIPVPVALAVFHLATAFVAYRAKAVVEQHGSPYPLR